MEALQSTVIQKNPQLVRETWKIQHLPIKRLFDLIFSFIILTVGFPLFLFIAIGVKLTSQGSIFYSQMRVGRGGKPFRCYKFRTMYSNADQRLQTLLENSPEKREEWLAIRKLKHDPRVTQFGKFLRKTSLDEIPQFFNVLKGDLSIVGPRPVAQDEIDRFFGIKAHKVLSVRPGLTGIWQVSGRSNTTYDQRIELDERYIDSQSFWLDLKLILKTIPCMISAKGAY